MKKRYYISCIITIILLMLTNKIWFTANIFYGYPFLIILICGYLLSLKLTSYLADFKNLQNQSRIEIIFLTVFFVMLFIPMSHINKNTVSKKENRKLAQYKTLIKNSGELNYNFGKDFDNWFNDRFYQRNNIIALNQITMSLLMTQTRNKGIIDNKTGFLYSNFELKNLTPKDIDKNFKNLYKFNKFCKENGIKLYVIITPQKAAIYPTKIQKFSDNNFSEYVEKTNKSNNIKIIYPIKTLKDEAKNNYVFFKTEHHWTDSGAYIGYKELMKEISKDFPNVITLTKKDFNYSDNKLVQADFYKEFGHGQTCDYLNLPEYICNKHLNVKYKYFTHKDYKNRQEKMIDENYHKEKIFYYPKGSNLKVIMLGTSQNEKLTEFIPFSFKHVKRIRINNVKQISNKEEFKIMKYYKQEILDYKPDIIIFCITYRNISHLKNLFEE